VIVTTNDFVLSGEYERLKFFGILHENRTQLASIHARDELELEAHQEILEITRI
jgi:hypothetical protein